MTDKKNTKKSKASGKFRPDIEKIREIINKIQLIDVSLLESRVKRAFVNIDFNDLMIQEKLVCDTIEEDPPANIFMGVCRFGLRGLWKEKIDTEVEVIEEDAASGEAFIIEGSFLMTYELEDRKGITTEDAASFVIVNGVHQAWPYWRELVQSMCCRMEIDPLTLPLKKPQFDLKAASIELAGKEKHTGKRTVKKTVISESQ